MMGNGDDGGSGSGRIERLVAGGSRLLPSLWLQVQIVGYNNRWRRRKRGSGSGGGIDEQDLIVLFCFYKLEVRGGKKNMCARG
jgi:hypothetical protein